MAPMNPPDFLRLLEAHLQPMRVPFSRAALQAYVEECWELIDDNPDVAYWCALPGVGVCRRGARMTACLSWFAAHDGDMARLSAGRRLIWVTRYRKGELPPSYGHFAELPPSVHIIDALEDYANGPGARKGGVEVRWQVWDRGQVDSWG